MRKGFLKRLLAVTLAGIMGVSTLIVGDTKHNTAEAAAITADYKLLLQQSLKFYDANMCGYINGKTTCSYRSNCHTGDAVVGGFHDAGDHMKFGITEAYSAFVLEMSMDTDKGAYQAAGEVNHHKVITEHFADYLYNCAVMSGSNVTKYCVQIGDGSDHSYWGSPEKQTGSRTAYYATSSAPCTDVVSLSAAALAMHYKNYGDSKYLTRAKQLFAFAKNNNKDGSGFSSGYYDKQDWKDDYCLAAIVLYNVTGDASYKSEYNKYGGDNLASYGGWYLCWGDVKGAISYYANKTNGLKACADKTKNGRTSEGLCIPEQWGSLRYSTSSMYMGLMYDRKTGTKTYQSWADGQMKKILGDNSRNICFVVGYNQYSVSHPHHRAASGYDWNSFNNNAKLKYTLTGALVGGPSNSLGGYSDRINDYTQNEVAIDYNATLVASAAALYTATGGAVTTSGAGGSGNISSGGNDTNLSYDGGGTIGVIAGGGTEANGVTVKYQSHIQNIGWNGGQCWGQNGSPSGTTGSSLRLEGIKITLNTPQNELGIQYATHIQNIGWQPWCANGEMSGTEGQSLRLEAIKIQLTGSKKDQYDVYYRVHAQNKGWMAWSKNGAAAGTAGQSLRLESIEIMVVEKDKAPASRSDFKTKYSFSKVGSSNENLGGADVPHIGYSTHVQNIGWQKEGYDGAMLGTTGRSLRLEGIKIKLMNKPNGVDGGIRYSTHVQNIGWQGFVYDGAMSGTSGRSLRLEAIKIELYGNMANYYDVYYRVHAQNFGWLGWAKNGAPAGTAGFSYRLEGIEIRVVPKGAAAPGSTANSFYQR